MDDYGGSGEKHFPIGFSKFDNAHTNHKALGTPFNDVIS